MSEVETAIVLLVSLLFDLGHEVLEAGPLHRLIMHRSLRRLEHLLSRPVPNEGHRLLVVVSKALLIALDSYDVELAGLPTAVTPDAHVRLLDLGVVGFGLCPSLLELLLLLLRDLSGRGPWGVHEEAIVHRLAHTLGGAHTHLPEELVDHLSHLGDAKLSASTGWHWESLP